MRSIEVISSMKLRFLMALQIVFVLAAVAHADDRMLPAAGAYSFFGNPNVLSHFSMSLASEA